MTNNKVSGDAFAEDAQIIAAAQKRLLRLYERKRKKGGWRAVATARGLSNVSYVHTFVTKGTVPPNPETRRKLFLPRVLPSERKPVKREPLPKVWECPELYLREVKP